METRILLQNGYRYALSLTHDKAFAEDLLQEAWAKMLKAGGPRHKGYLYAAIRNGFIDERRRNKVVSIVPTEVPELYADALVGADVRAERRQRLARALAVLRPEEREALYLNAVEGYTADEIGKLSETPRNTVLSLLHRARRKVLAAFDAETTQEVLP
ncbi:MAG: RNA polymerase sigma factor [Myxococcota bacterium]